MPLFGKKKKEASPTHQPNTTNPLNPSPYKNSPNSTGENASPNLNGGNHSNAAPLPPMAPIPPADIRKPKYKFHCQLAHGSPTGIITGFTNVKELYKMIAETYNINPNEILFCTLNTHKIEMDHLLGGQIALDDFIFAHTKGQKKEIDIVKSEDALGLTITDNGAGYAFIKRIKPESIMDKQEMVEVGDHIEKINGESFVGKRHFDVAKRLKEISKNETFTLRLISPEKTPFANLGSRSGAGAGKGTSGINSGKKTLRLRATGEATEEEAPSDVEDAAIKAINRLIESILGIDDVEMAQRIWEIGRDIDNPHNFSVTLDNEMGEFGFSDDLIFDFWGAISDAKAQRLPSQKSKTSQPVYFSEQF